MRQILTLGVFLTLLLTGSTIFAQVGVGTITPNQSAQLDVTSTNKGFLPPRLTLAQRGTIPSPVAGLLIYQTDNTPGFYYFDGDSWQPFNQNFSTASVGFAASKTAAAISSSGTITDWTTTQYSSTPGAFNTATGVYTVPATGVYKITATINYATAAALSVSLGAGIDPGFEVRNLTTSTSIAGGLFPVLNVNVVLVLTLRAVLGNGTVNFTGTAPLTAGQTLDLYYNADGLSLALNLGGISSTSPGIQWSVVKID
ncbi:hypothetical protein [Dyadobacter bucti]|jgi:hypothetical protein|uniref:hypothetical protein n=1 Tax=Dyadobacter bucti TaxID=2572203 RepID=UPI003F6E8ACC